MESVAQRYKSAAASAIFGGSFAVFSGEITMFLPKITRDSRFAVKKLMEIAER